MKKNKNSQKHSKRDLRLATCANEKAKKALRLLRMGGSVADGVVCFSRTYNKMTEHTQVLKQNKLTTPSASLAAIDPSHRRYVAPPT